MCCALIWRGAAFRVAFGSCSRSTLDQPLWSNILEREPQLWVWSGDVVYGDEMKSLVPFVFESGGVDGLRRHYERQNAVPDYAALVAKVPIVATWDDHDYGLNDAGRTLSAKPACRRATYKHERREREGLLVGRATPERVERSEEEKRLVPHQLRSSRPPLGGGWMSAIPKQSKTRVIQV